MSLFVLDSLLIAQGEQETIDMRTINNKSEVYLTKIVENFGLVCSNLVKFCKKVLS